MTEADLSQPERHRREKLVALRAMGAEPFAYGFNRSHTAPEIHLNPPAAVFQVPEDHLAFGPPGLDPAGNGDRGSLVPVGILVQRQGLPGV